MQFLLLPLHKTGVTVAGFFLNPFWGGFWLIIQIFFAIHAYKNGRTGWIFIILFFPMAGVLIYFFAEFLPDMRHDRTMEHVSANLVKKLAPERELQRLKDQAAFNNSVNNQVALARGHMEVGQFDEAIEILRGCLNGLYANDPQILSALASAHLGAGKTQEALEILTLLRKEHPRYKDTGLLIARVLEHMNDLEGACREYQTILSQSIGEEVRCRYALLLKKLGRDDEAKAAFEEILRNVKVSPRYYRRSQRAWIQVAKQELRPKTESPKRAW
jgi:hypothetical protein